MAILWFAVAMLLHLLQVILVLESSMDKATSVLFILLLLVGSTLFGIIFAVQVG